MEQPKLTPEEEKQLDAISHQLMGNTFQPNEEKDEEKPKELTTDELIIDAAMRNMR